jgi:hypothetical protein
MTPRGLRMAGLSGAVLLIPALAGAKDAGQVTLTAEPALIKFHTTNVSVHGQLVGVAKPGNVQVTLRRAVYPFKSFRVQARGRTDSTGDFAFTVAPSVNTQYQATAAAKPNVRSPAVGVLVLRQVTIKLSSGHPRAGRRFRVSGFVYPKEDGDNVELQFGRGGTWRTVQTGRIYDVGRVRSGYRFVLAAPHLRANVRVVLPEDQQHPPSASNVRPVRPRRG